MKKLYYLDNSERNRILEMHNKATKNQYLLIEGFNENPAYDEACKSIIGKNADVVQFTDVMMVDGAGLNNIRIKVEVKEMLTNKGSWLVYNNYYSGENEYGSGEWTVKNGKITVKSWDGKMNATADVGFNTLTPEFKKYIVYKFANSEGLGGVEYTKAILGLATETGTKIPANTKLATYAQQTGNDNLVDGGDSGQGGAQGNCKGWTWDLVGRKYPCVSSGMFYSTQPECSEYGDRLYGKINNKKYTFYIGDGHLFSDTGKDLGYFACSSSDGKLEKISGRFLDKTNQDMTPIKESKKREFVRMITEAGWGDVGDSGGGGGGGDKKERKHRGTGSTGSSSGGYLSNLQNKIAELDTSYKPTGSMDQTTINKVMELLTKGVKPPEPTPTPYQVNQTTNNAQSED